MHRSISTTSVLAIWKEALTAVRYVGQCQKLFLRAYPGRKGRAREGVPAPATAMVYKVFDNTYATASIGTMGTLLNAEDVLDWAICHIVCSCCHSMW